MLTRQLAHRREPRGRRRRGQELACQDRDEIVDGPCPMSFANLKHNGMIPAGPPLVQPASGGPGALRNHPAET
jgi:hypothetical protein